MLRKGFHCNIEYLQGRRTHTHTHTEERYSLSFRWSQDLPAEGCCYRSRRGPTRNTNINLRHLTVQSTVQVQSTDPLPRHCIWYVSHNKQYFTDCHYTSEQNYLVGPHKWDEMWDLRSSAMLRSRSVAGYRRFDTTSFPFSVVIQFSRTDWF
jgi:hypothetical protein